jgi:hypothetical protein
MLPMTKSPLQSAGRVGMLVVLFLLGCAGPNGTPPGSDSADATLPVEPQKVRAALIEILTANGYTVHDEEGNGRVLTTGYRKETDSPWDWMLRRRFGVGRSLVVATILPEEPTMTRLSIQVSYEEKNRIWHTWHTAQPPVPLSAENHVRLLKNALGVL